MLRAGLLSLCFAIFGCGRSTGTELAHTSENISAIESSPGALVITVFTNESSDDKGPLVDLFAVGSGGLKKLAHLPAGPFQIEGNSVYYATALGGDIYSIDIAGGEPHPVATHVGDEVHGIAAVNGGIVVLAQARSAQQAHLIKIDVPSGNITQLPPGPGDTITYDTLVARRGDATYLASAKDGTTIRITRAGAVEPVPAPHGNITCLAADKTTLWWIQQDFNSASAVPTLYSKPFDGALTTVANAIPNTVAAINCAASDDELFFIRGNHVVGRKHDGTTRDLATAKDFTGLVVDQGRLIWGDELNAGSFSLRAVSL